MVSRGIVSVEEMRGLGGFDGRFNLDVQRTIDLQQGCSALPQM